MGIKPYRVVIAVDCQFDFTIAGKLPVPEADGAWIGEVNLFMHLRKASKRDGGLLLIATRDWHPTNHISFNEWPVHCVQGTPGSELVFNSSLIDHTVYKGTHAKYDSYSAFKDDDGNETTLNLWLMKNLIKEINVFGLATDYCVKATVLDALELGFKTNVITDLCRGITPETTKKALVEMKRKGASLVGR